MLTIRFDDSLAISSMKAIRAGDVATLERLLVENPELAATKIKDRKGGCRSLLHIAADWPGHFPNGGAIVYCLLKTSADVEGGVQGQGDTPLHWAASSDDVEVAEVLVAGGADLNAPNGSIGTPLENAVGYGQWQIARFLVDRGAKVDKLWVAAALGMASRVAQFLAQSPPPTKDEINDAFWQACHGGQIRTAKMLLEHGADINFNPFHNNSTPLDIAGNFDSRREALVDWLKENGAQSKERVKV